MNLTQSTAGSNTSDNTAVVEQRISPNFAQLVQTSTGKHLLLTSNPNAPGNIPVSDGKGKLTDDYVISLKFI